MSIASEIERIETAKNDIATALTNKGVTVPEAARIDEYAPLIDEMKAGGNYQSKSAVPSKTEQVITPDEGYDALSMVFVDRTPLEEKTVTPTTSGVVVTPEGDNVGLSKVNVLGDGNLTSSNIKAGTTIFGVTGTYEGSGGGGGGGGYADIGVRVSVEAHASFAGGDRFVGVKNEGIKPEILSAALNTPTGYSIQTMSADMSVVTFSQTISSASTKYYIGILKADANEYELVEVNLPDLSWLTATANRSKINEDGTLILIPGLKNSDKYFSGAIIISVNKTSKTATARAYSEIPTNDVIYNGENASLLATSSSYIANNWGIANRYIYYNPNGKLTYTKTNSDGSTEQATKSQSISFLYYYNGSSLTKIWDLFGTGTSGGSDVISINSGELVYLNDEDLIVFDGQKSSSSSPHYLTMFHVNGSSPATMTRGMAFSTTPHFSSNGRYFTHSSSTTAIDIYSIQGGTVNWLGAVTPPTSGSTTYREAYPDDTGEYLWIKTENSVRSRLDFATSLGTATVNSPYFNAVYGGKFRDGSYLKWLSPNSEDVEYLIYPTQAYIEEEDRIYGIVPKSIAIGEVGTAQGLFSTYTVSITKV